MSSSLHSQCSAKCLTASLKSPMTSKFSANSPFLSEASVVEVYEVKYLVGYGEPVYELIPEFLQEQRLVVGCDTPCDDEGWVFSGKPLLHLDEAQVYPDVFPVELHAELPVKLIVDGECAAYGAFRYQLCEAHAVVRVYPVHYRSAPLVIGTFAAG